MSYRRHLVALLGLAGSLICLGVCEGKTDEVEGGHWSEKRFRIQTAVGFTTFDLAGSKGTFESIHQELRKRWGIPIPTQRNFSSNAIVGLDALYRLTSAIEAGLGGRYTASPAESIYEDYAGRLELSGSVRMFTLEAIIQTRLPEMGWLRPYVGARGGLAHARIRFTTKIESSEFPEMAGSEEIESDNIGCTIEAYAGVQRPLGNLALAGQFGYRYAQVPDALGLDLDLKGITAILLLAIPL